MRTATALLIFLTAVSAAPNPNPKIIGAPISPSHLLPRMNYCDNSTFTGETMRKTLPDVKECQSAIAVLSNSWLVNQGWDLNTYSKDSLVGGGRCTFTAHTITGTGFLGTQDALYLIRSSLALMQENGYIKVRGIIPCNGVYIAWSLSTGLLSAP